MGYKFNPFTNNLDFDSKIGTPTPTTDNAIVVWDGTTGSAIQQATSNIPTITDTGIASFPEDDFADCERIGASSSVTGARATALGCQATSTQDSVAIGERAQCISSSLQTSVGANSVVNSFGGTNIGIGGSVSGVNASNFGNSGSTSGQGATNFGASGSATAAYAMNFGFACVNAYRSACFGRSAFSTADKQWVMGGIFQVFEDYFFGCQDDGTNPNQFTGEYTHNYAGPSTSFTDASANDVIFNGPRGTGTGTGGHWKFYVAPASTTGSTQNTRELALEITDDKETICHSTLSQNGNRLSFQNTTVTETINISELDIVRQTVSGITTSLSGMVSGQVITIKNRSSGNNNINITLDGNALPLIKKDEAFRILYNGTDWDLI